MSIVTLILEPFASHDNEDRDSVASFVGQREKFEMLPLEELFAGRVLECPWNLLLNSLLVYIMAEVMGIVTNQI